MADEKEPITTISFTSIGKQVDLRKTDGDLMLSVIRSNALDADDEFANFFGRENALRQKVDILGTPYNMNTLAGLCQMNNALQPSIEAMVTNIDGTGHSIRPREEPKKDEKKSADEEGNTEEKAKQERIEDFFNEVFPGMSFITLRKKLRRDLETVGNAYIEIMRSLEGKLVFLRWVRAKDVRLIKFDDPIEKEVTLTRNGERITIKMLATERRYAQIVGNKMVFFKEMNASRELHKTQGVWEGSEILDSEDKLIQPADKANELIHLTMVPDVRSPYGLPRWVPQMPSVLGSRKAEEHNLEFFDSGGIPPVLITIAGGKAAVEGAKAIEQFLSGESRHKQRGVVMEIQTMGGSLEKEGTGAKVEVHRFGAEQVKDSMFEKYDDKSEKRVRRAFRLPPLFVGMAEDFSFATAFASYTVAEAQVFQPERIEFDEMVNNLIMPELDPEREFEFFSLPITVNDTVQRLEAITIALEAGGIDAEGVIEALNDLVNLDLKFNPDAGITDVSGKVVNNPATGDQPLQGSTPAGAQSGPGKPSSIIAATENVVELAKVGHLDGKKKKRKAVEMVELATRANGLMHKSINSDSDAEALVNIGKEIAELDEEDLSIFQTILSVMQFDNVENDPIGLSRLAGCSLAVMVAQVQ